MTSKYFMRGAAVSGASAIEQAAAGNNWLSTLDFSSHFIAALACLSIVAALFWLCVPRKDLRNKWPVLLTGILAALCGALHFLIVAGIAPPTREVEDATLILSAVMIGVGGIAFWPVILRSVREPPQSMQQLQLVIRQLEHEVVERKRAEEELQKSQELLRQLAAYQEQIKEDERKRIAREIHDELGQNLMALRIDVSILQARTGTAHPILNEKVRYVLSHIDMSIKAVRAIINNLRPSVLDLGLSAAIEWQVTEFQRRTGIECEVVMDDSLTDHALDDSRATALFRILQESLTNVARHAQATLVQIGLHREGEFFNMRIADNGVGIFPGCRRKPNSFGLLGIGERVSTLGGQFTVESAPGAGTILNISIPMMPVEVEAVGA
jgi:signal transduction histidine kinase